MQLAAKSVVRTVDETVDDTIVEFVDSVVEHTVAGNVHTYPSMVADALLQGQKIFYQHTLKL